MLTVSPILPLKSMPQSVLTTAGRTTLRDRMPRTALAMVPACVLGVTKALATMNLQVHNCRPAYQPWHGCADVLLPPATHDELGKLSGVSLFGLLLRPRPAAQLLRPT